jgi:hypothetical protein
MGLEIVSQGTAQTNVGGSSILDKLNEALAAGGVAPYGPFDVSAIPAIVTFLTDRTNGLSLNLTFFADQAMTINMGGWRANLLPSAAPVGDGSINQAWPTLGPWMTCTITASIVGPITYDIRLSAAPVACAPLDSGGRPSLIFSENVAIAAAGNATRQSFRTQPGLGFWMAGQDAGTWTAKLESLNQDGAGVTLLDKADSRDGRCARLVPLPARPLRITINNTDGAAGHNADFSLSVVPQLG